MPQTDDNSDRLASIYPPSKPCSCTICKGFCARPGWWTPAEARKALAAGYGDRMMLEIAPERTFGVLAPAFKGCEMDFAWQEYSHLGCTFLQDGMCELHSTGYLPFECRFCHHERLGSGKECHAEIEREWHRSKGEVLIRHWMRKVRFKHQDYYLQYLRRGSGNSRSRGNP
jgi:hypothetical protein